MTVTLTAPASSVTVESDGDILRGTAVAFGTFGVADVGSKGQLVAYQETWDKDSIILGGRRIPVNRSHDRSQPVGYVLSWDLADEGLMVEAKLSGSRESREHLRQLVADNLLAGLSVAFAHTDKDQWKRPEKKGELPSVTRRGIRISELSLVDRPALAGSGVRSITRRSAEREAYEATKAKAQVEQRVADRALIAEVDGILDDAKARQAEKERLFAEVDQAVARQKELEEEFAARSQQAEVRRILRAYREEQGMAERSRPVTQATYAFPTRMTPEEMAAWRMLEAQRRVGPP